MCAPHTVIGKALAGSSDMVIKSDKPLAQAAADYGMNPDGTPLAPPKKTDLTAPDLTDEAIREARSSELLRLKSGQGRRSTFLTGPMGSTGDVTKPGLMAVPDVGPVVPTGFGTLKKNKSKNTFGG